MKDSIKTIILFSLVLQLFFSCQHSVDETAFDQSEINTESAVNSSYSSRINDNKKIKDSTKNVVYRLINYATGLALSTGAQTESGSGMILENIEDSKDQHWEIIEQDQIEFEGEIIDFYYLNIRSVATGMYLALPNYCYDLINNYHCDGVVQEEDPDNNRGVWIPIGEYEEYDEYESEAINFFNRASSLSLSADESETSEYADMDYFFSYDTDELRGYSLFVVQPVRASNRHHKREYVLEEDL